MKKLWKLENHKNGCSECDLKGEQICITETEKYIEVLKKEKLEFLIVQMEENCGYANKAFTYTPLKSFLKKRF